jgi:hypothetical protein
MLGRDVDVPDLLEVVERTVEPFAPEEHAADGPCRCRDSGQSPAIQT